MKELSIEEKASRYDEAIKRVEDIKTGKCETTFMFTVGLFEYIFPELEENEDERMRNAAINACKYMVDNFENSTKQYEEAIAWLEKQGKNNMGISEATKQKLEDNLNKALEKETPEYWNKFLDEQGEQNPTDKIEPKFKVGDTIYYNSFGKIESMVVVNIVDTGDGNPMYEDSEGDAVFEKCVIEMKTPEESLGVDSGTYNKIVDECIYGDDKSAWSEEDEDVINHLLAICAVAKRYRQFAGCLQEDITKYQTFLKSLKERYAWKPSDEQLDALHDAAVYVDKSMFPYPKGILMKLHEQLKKLKG